MSSKTGLIVTVGAISACSAIILSEIVRRIFRNFWKADKRSTSSELSSNNEVTGLPELGKKLREREYTSMSDDLHFMNNGSYGHVPDRVMAEQKRLMDELERCPEHWYRMRIIPMYKAAVKVVAEFVNAKPENLVLVENVTTATNCIFKSFKFEPGDKILLSNHTYGAVNETLKLVVEQHPGVSLVVVEIPLPPTHKEILAIYTRAFDENPEVKIAIVDHITSASAIRMPIKDLTDLCQSRGAVIAIDGAHGPGQVPLHLEELGADFYFGNLHKWLFSARCCALMYVHPRHHSWIRHAISSHETFDEDLQTRFHYTGTRDDIPYFTAKHAIGFHNYLGGLERITAYNKGLAYWAAKMLSEEWKTSWVELEPELHAPFMCLVQLPESPKLLEYKRMPGGRRHGGARILANDFNDKYKLYVSIIPGGEHFYLRISAQVYNYKEEFYMICDAFKEHLEIK